MRPSLATTSACSACLRAYSSAVSLGNAAAVLQQRLRFFRERDHPVYEASAGNVFVGEAFANGKRAEAKIFRDRAIGIGLETARHACERLAFFGNLETVALQGPQHRLETLRVFRH